MWETTLRNSPTVQRRGDRGAGQAMEMPYALIISEDKPEQIIKTQLRKIFLRHR